MNYAALHFLDFALNALLVRDGTPADQPAAFLSTGERDKSHLIAINQTARSFGVEVGFRTTQALARCPHLLLLNPHPPTETSARRETLAFVDSLAPDFELTTPETFLVDLSTMLLTSEADWTANTLDSAACLGFPLRIGLGPTPDLAHLASLGDKPNNPLTLPLNRLVSEHTFPLPHAEVLHLWGLRTLEDLARIPRQGLVERLGPELARLHDIAHGKHHRLLKPYRPEPHYRIQHHFEPPVDHLEPFLFMAKRLLQTLCNRLDHHQRTAAELLFTLAFENGTTHTRTLVLSEPTLNTDTLVRHLHTDLDTFRSPAPMNEFHLELTPTLPKHAQHQLFQRGLRDPNQFADTLRRLAGIVGTDRIGIPETLDSHRPDSFALHPVTPGFHTPPFYEDTPLTRLPLNRQRPPLAIHVASEKRGRHQHPLALLTGPYQGSVLQTRGPFPLSGSWWDRQWQEAQWDVELPDSLLLQLTFQPPETWFLTGIYG